MTDDEFWEEYLKHASFVKQKEFEEKQMLLWENRRIEWAKEYNELVRRLRRFLADNDLSQSTFNYEYYYEKDYSLINEFSWEYYAKELDSLRAMVKKMEENGEEFKVIIEYERDFLGSHYANIYTY